MRKMNFQSANYEVRPGVVLSGQTTTVRIVPRGRHARFDDKLHRLTWSERRNPHQHAPEILAPDSETGYRIYFLPMQESRDPRGLEAYESVTVKPERDGSLQFQHMFTGEQEYGLVITAEQEKKEVLKLSIYSLLPDLYGRRVYRGDQHAHSFFSDGKEDPCVVAANYRKYGYDYMALTDHHKIYPSRLLLQAYEKVPLELAVFTGEEVHVPYPSDIHAVNFGGKASVNEYYVDHQTECNEEIAKMAETLSKTEEAVSFDALQVAQRIWVAQKIREFGGMPILVHPHWINNNTYNMPDVMTDYLLKNQVYDAFELLGGLSVHENNLQTAFYHEERAKGCRIPVVGSTDSHGTEPPRCFNDISTLVYAFDPCFESLTAAIKDCYSVAVEEYQEENQYRLHGPYRMVKYGRYLMETYFPRHDEMCWEQGRLMKDYALGDPDAEEMLRLVYGRVERYAQEFFGY